MKKINVYFIFSTFLIITWYNIGCVKGIVGGTNVNDDQHSYTISLQANGVHVCSGVIIGKQHVLTAAVCVVDQSNSFRQAKFTIVAGAIDTSIKDDPKRVVQEVDKIFVPKIFKTRETVISYFTRYSDRGNIAVLKLKEPFDFEKYTTLRVLRYPNTSKSLSTYRNHKVTVAGFGIENTNNREYEGDDTVYGCSNHCTKLKFAETIVLDKRVCKKYATEILQNNHLCAQMIQYPEGTSAGVCDGDIGSPLVLNYNVIIGILIHVRRDCNESKGIALYTKVASMMEFVYDTVFERSFKNSRIALYSRIIDSDHGQIEKLVEYYEFL